MAVQITLSDLREKVNAGWKKAALAEHYGIPVSQMTTALRQAGLTIRKFHHPKFELVDDTVQDVNDSVSEVDHQAEEQVLQELVVDAGEQAMNVEETNW